MPAPGIGNFGDENHGAGETGLVVDGGGFGPFPGSLWIFENADRSGAADQLTVAGDWNDIQLTGVAIPASPNNLSGTRYLALQRSDLAWSNAFAFTFTAAGVVLSPVDIAQSQVLDGVALSQTHQIAPADIVQAQVLDGIGLTQQHLITVGELAQLQVLDGVGLIIEGTLVPIALAQLNVLDGVAISQAHVVSPADIAQLQVLDNVATAAQIRWLSASRLLVYPNSGGQGSASRFSRLWMSYDAELRLEELVDETGAEVTDATVELIELKDADGNDVAGISLPVPMPHISAGSYHGALPASIVSTAGSLYKAKVRAVANGATAPFTETLIATQRSI